MTIEELQAVIHQALESCQSGSQGVNIFDKFTPLEVGDFVNNIILALPLNSDGLIAEVKYRVFDVYKNEEIIEDYIAREITALFRLQLMNKINREQLSLLIFYLMFMFKIRFEDDSLTLKLQEVVQYFYSYLIPNTTELLNEVKESPVTGESKQIHNTYIRVDTDFKFIPTRTTSVEFTNYLY